MRIFIPFFMVSALLDCSGGEQAAPEPVRVENESMGIVLSDLPPGFELSANEPGRLEIVRGRAVLGRAWFEVGAVQEAGINVVDIVNAQKEDYLAKPGGEFSGNRELQMGNGRAGYYSRGQFEDAGRVVEEFRITTLHPAEERLLQVFYRYALANDSADRLNDVLLILDQIEALEADSDPDGTSAGVTEEVTE